MLTIRQASTEELPEVRALFWEYLQWANGMLSQSYGVSFDIATMLQQDMAEIGKFMPPKGRLLIASDATDVFGCACARTHDPNIAELKRMYVRPGERRKGVGRSLVEALIADLRGAGCLSLRLDSAGFMHEAHALYHSLAFRRIDAYPESEIPAALHGDWVFMERSL
jgi:GNAT superfamily N-acetyltransferase